MIPSDPDSVPVEIRRALAEILAAALRPAGSAKGLRDARDAARIVSLPGLERALVVCLAHAGRPWPAEIVPLVERMRRLAGECSAADSLAPLVAADRDLAGLAGEVEGLEWSPRGAAEAADLPAISTLSLAEILEDLPIAASTARESLARVRIVAPVAAALRASLDWLAHDGVEARPIGLVVEDSCVTLTFDRVAESGIQAAAHVLGDVGGNLGPIEPRPEGAGPAQGWMVRVPRFAPRPTFLMLVQGNLCFAVPWHAVLRIRVRMPDERDESAGAYPQLPRLDPGPRPFAAQPAVLVAHGLKRAQLVADRLVWRLQADEHPTDRVPPLPGLVRSVRTEEGVSYWVADPAWLLAEVDLPRLAPAGDPRTPVVLTRADVEPLGVPGPVAPAVVNAAPVQEVSVAVGSVAVAEVESPSAPPEPAAAPGESTLPVAEPTLRVEPASTPAEPAPASPGARVLVAEGSITARIFLTRLLEQQGAIARAVGNAAELQEAVGSEPWTMVCFDLEVPDARGAAPLDQVVRTLRRRAPRAILVALVRDEAERAAAAAAGVTRTLEKPFERAAVEELLSSLAREIER